MLLLHYNHGCEKNDNNNRKNTTTTLARIRDVRKTSTTKDKIITAQIGDLIGAIK